MNRPLVGDMENLSEYSQVGSIQKYQCSLLQFSDLFGFVLYVWKQATNTLRLKKSRVHLLVGLGNTAVNQGSICHTVELGGRVGGQQGKKEEEPSGQSGESSGKNNRGLRVLVQSAVLCMQRANVLCGGRRRTVSCQKTLEVPLSCHLLKFFASACSFAPSVVFEANQPNYCTQNMRSKTQ